jgi:hypothetical protein
LAEGHRQIHVFSGKVGEDFDRWPDISTPISFMTEIAFLLTTVGFVPALKARACPRSGPGDTLGHL